MYGFITQHFGVVIASLASLAEAASHLQVHLHALRLSPSSIAYTHVAHSLRFTVDLFTQACAERDKFLNMVGSAAFPPATTHRPRTIT